MKTITIEVNCGIIEVVRQSPGTKLVVLDYDCQEEQETDARVRRDRDDRLHYRTTTTRKEKP